MLAQAEAGLWLCDAVGHQQNKAEGLAVTPASIQMA